MKLIKKSFKELTTNELYELLKARSEIFVVEQKILCQDLDGEDYNALHVFYEEDRGSVAACLRILPQSGKPNSVKIGRVLTVNHGQGLGKRILREGILAASEIFGASEITVNAQKHAVGFYEREGFETVSDEFIEAGIPHIKMRLTII